MPDELIAFGKNTGWQKHLLDFSKEYSTEVKRYYKEYIDNYKKENF